ncbi:acetylornithine deacetylase/succinyl-diaminopimelate desuccinylase family protein [Pseudosulfitobacter pseudonitzschiae]|uniref:acetylornithine deacetylase/succinyl-diaminopimelate desuccinylase family protein n=1 Tax=Pseudosulfitobacter pseudonitzschiae TaxID=1402135 RepID=UPI001AFCC002|nr:acetylornithine deacetylase/succinyl-diaminopimelate desuccinylase family protein [Pseudosulfitobacter pseudonitzschiae]MBM1815540.1 acetylornithine deacetylase/succinyl-diaminopimelate desuccinylase family protein [Pseudosulfitobacter pseudonitzschiae]MBM1832531.1 acetylornithine deacetylase/succinyl-diaminopimelate desuccinylase family protein [Pseudosulfitobacter pseudonitzschiae]MBM1837399.1 acetylornithine deacetylase/succinyl-diaminopimelate desuccinylase family protein [Pseudosulfitoba
MTVSHRITDKRDDLIQLTQDLIRIPTLNPPGENYREICDFLDKRLSKHGFQTQLIRAHGTPGDSEKYPRWNIVARRDGAQTGECVHFNSHTDVVEVGQGWTFDPFGGAVSDGKIYGRGACDMKGGLAASIIAAEAFIEEHPNFQGAIEISGTADEESGGYGGVAYLAEQGFFDPNKVQHVIIPEPLQKDRICLGHRGGWWAEIETKGEIAHGSMPFLGDCAVRHMGAVLSEFETKLYPAMAARFTEMPVVPEGARQSTMNINSIHGGQKEQTDDFNGLPAHCVPDSCRIVIDRRYLVEETLDEVRDEVKALLEGLRETRPDFEYELTELNSVIPSMTDKTAPVVETVAKAIEDVMGKPPTYVASPGSYDQKHIDRIGKLKNCIAYGPGLLELAHKPDEYIGIDDMVDSAKVMGAALETLLLPKG